MEYVQQLETRDWVMMFYGAPKYYASMGWSPQYNGVSATAVNWRLDDIGFWYYAGFEKF